MRKMLMIGLTLLTTLSCSTGIVKDPQDFYFVNTKFLAIAKGTKNFNVKTGRKLMTEWVEKPELLEWNKAPKNLACFEAKIWLERIKPTLKELAQKYKDDRD